MNTKPVQSPYSPSGKDVPLDLRGLPPPQPMERIMEALDTLKAGDALQVQMDREPHPLFGMLERGGYRHHGDWSSDAYVLRIWQRAD
ncbi:DUF2249 domain-containing protein [Pseudoduganella aquatica]|uniref:DUF2249 domain-containing protein n=1 Tax=Pseudoduganella aquatica TaxID=2660641 RepID=A0A7X4HGM5_9BURK|nr:DUF2249 domain-containing protein [Pseudoduganella aquatica]MYN10162.1 DUF2249 domain-containing protein [Pseudoduganella aquatica]